MTPRKVLPATVAALTLAAVLAGCGDAEETPSDDPRVTTAPSPTGEASTPAAPDAEVFEFEIADGRATPPLDRAAVGHGTTVRIVVISDQPDEIHLHGYDLAAEVGPGKEGVIEFVADQIGLFELETHESGLILLQLEVR